jgi:hypothetical protein
MESLSKEEQINLLKGIRSLSNGCGVVGKNKQILLPGDLVYDEKNKEYGIFMGIKPLIDHNTTLMKKFIQQAFSKILDPKPEYQTCALMTISVKPGGSTHEIRIRYTNSRWLEKIVEQDGQETSVSDLDHHCQYECFMECSAECSLWKYKRTPKQT